MKKQENKEEVLNKFLNYKEVSVKSKPKLKDIRFYTNNFFNSQKKQLKDFNENDLALFINSISKKYKTGTMNTIKAYIKQAIKWYFPDWSSRFRNLEKLCATQKVEKTYLPEDMLSKEDIQKIVQSEYELSWKVYFLLLFYGGFRPSELCNLDSKQITFEKEGAFIKIYSAKNKEYFDKIIPEDVCFYLKKHLEQNKSKWVFPTKFKNERGDVPIKEKAVYQRLIRISKIALGKEVNPYQLRHSIATILYNRDDIKDDDVARQMGHKKEMKQVYVNLDEGKLKERARRIYIKPEELPPEKKIELEKRIEQLEKILELQGWKKIREEENNKTTIPQTPSLGNMLGGKIKVK